MTKLIPFERPFFGRSEILEWVDDWLQKCEGRGIVLGIFGMGGIGKTAILRELNKTHKYSIYVECSKDDLMTLLNTISARARRIGFGTPRFSRLRDIQLWFLEGIQPAKPASKGWIKDLVAWIPQINMAVKIATAISTAGQKLTQLFVKHYGHIDQWFRDMVGPSYGTTILEFLTRDPEQAFNLFLEALVADLNSAATEDDLPLLLLLDSFEHIDADRYDDTPYPGLGIKLTQAEKWHLFLKKLTGAVGIISGRTLPHIPQKMAIQRIDREITELDRESCKMLLESRGINDSKFIHAIISVSHRNPFVINTICDIWDRGELFLEEVLELKADALIEVREKTWTLLFSKAKNIWNTIECAALLPFFDFQILAYANPGLNQISWKELIRFSFIQYDEPYWTLHELARELALAEQEEVVKRANDVRINLGKAYNRTQNPILLGLSLSAINYVSERKALLEVLDVTERLLSSKKYHELISALEAYEPASTLGESIVQWYRGSSLLPLNRIGEARLALLSALKGYKEMRYSKAFDYRPRIGYTQELLGITHLKLGDNKTAEGHFLSSLKVFESLDKQFPKKYSHDLMRILGNMGSFYIDIAKIAKGEDHLKKALEINNTLDSSDSRNFPIRLVILNALGNLYKDTGREGDAKATYNQALEDAEGMQDISDDLKSVLSSINCNLGLLYYNMDEFDKAREAHEKSMHIILELVRKRPDLYQDLLPGTLTNIGLLDAMEKDFERAIENYNKALSHYRELAEENPGFYSRDIAMVLFNTGLALRESGKIQEAILILEESRDIYSKVSLCEPTMFIPRLANVCSHLGVAYLQTKRLNDSSTVLKESLKMFEELDQEILQLCISDYAFALNHMGSLQLELKNLDTALEYFGKSLTHFEDMCSSNPSGNLPYVGMTLSNISAVYTEKGNSREAEKIALRGLRIYSSIIQQRPLLFLGNGLKLIVTLRTLYEEAMNLSPDDVITRLRFQLKSIFGEEMTEGLLKILEDSDF